MYRSLLIWVLPDVPWQQCLTADSSEAMHCCQSWELNPVLLADNNSLCQLVGVSLSTPLKCPRRSFWASPCVSMLLVLL